MFVMSHVDGIASAERADGPTMRVGIVSLLHAASSTAAATATTVATDERIPASLWDE
jgi:hypothetical protein